MWRAVLAAKLQAGNRSRAGLLGFSVIAAAIAALYLLSRSNYLLFHALVELFAIAVACGVFMVAWNSRRFLNNGFFLVIGAASLGVAFLEAIHLLAYRGMGVFPDTGANLPTQLWIAARWLQVGALVVAPFCLTRRPRPAITLASCVAATALLLASIFWWRIFPDCFVEGVGLTPFKIASEYLFVFLLIGAILLMRRRRQDFDPRVLRRLVWSCGAFSCAELAFTLYTDVFGIANMTGHLFEVIGFYFVYRAVIETGLTHPVDLLFRELSRNEQALRQRTRELEDANARLEVANRDLEAFNYSVSHDLRSPLTAISGRCQVLLHLFDKRLDPEVRTFIEGIDSQIFQMNDLITTLLEFARLGTIELKRQPVDLSPMADLIARGLMVREPDRQVAFAIAPGSKVLADPQLALIALTNLLGNAWKYTGKTAAAQIAFGSTEVDGTRVFFVSDNGAGFDMTQASELFEPFRRLHAEKEYAGFGIGLATVKRIVDRHGGRIWAEGVVGQGATFYFTL